jgi:hypothetical protein
MDGECEFVTTSRTHSHDDYHPCQPQKQSMGRKNSYGGPNNLYTLVNIKMIKNIKILKKDSPSAWVAQTYSSITVSLSETASILCIHVRV